MTDERKINLALQGGGAHGAFTWGVLDRLLDETALSIDAISGTSAGALNGAAFKAGWVVDGREGARAALDDLWDQILSGPTAGLSSWLWPASPADISRGIEYSAAYAIGEAWSRMVSPYAWGPLYNNP